jgi:hypothetical protein
VLQYWVRGAASGATRSPRPHFPPMPAVALFLCTLSGVAAHARAVLAGPVAALVVCPCYLAHYMPTQVWFFIEGGHAGGASLAGHAAHKPELPSWGRGSCVSLGMQHTNSSSLVGGAAVAFRLACSTHTRAP